MRTVNECIAQIGKSGSTILFFHGSVPLEYHQMLLEHNSKKEKHIKFLK